MACNAFLTLMIISQFPCYIKWSISTCFSITGSLHPLEVQEQSEVPLVVAPLQG